VAVIAYIAAAFVASIWIALRAKPLGYMPYRWGTFLGVSYALSSPPRLVSAFLAFAAGHLFGGLMFVVEVILSIWSCIGLLQRRRAGVVVFAMLWVVQTMNAPFLEVTPAHPFLQTIKIKTPSLSELVTKAKFFPNYRLVFLFTAVSAVVTYIYFKKRWQLMADHTP
jgi:hypothetical protein